MNIKIKYLLLITFLVALPAICITDAQVLVEKKINLLPEDIKHDAILVPENVVRMSKTLNSMLEDLGQVTDNMTLPVKNINKRTLSAIVNSLEGMHKLQEKKKKYRFNSLKWLIKNSFPLDYIASSSDLLNFLLAANFLDIPDLLGPATAEAVDSVIAKGSKDKPKGKEKIFAELVWELSNALAAKKDTANFFESKVKPLLKKLRIPVELFHYFSDYLKYKNDPTSWITQIGEPISVGKQPQALVVVGDKLYVSNYLSDNISVIDLKTNQAARDPIAVGSGPTALIVFGNKLYVANEKNHNISVIDLESDQVVGDPIDVGSAPKALSVFGHKLYVANRDSNNISVIDLESDRVVGEPIAVGDLPSALFESGNKLYVANTKSHNISVIDLETDQVADDPIAVGWVPTAISIDRNKLYVAETRWGGYVSTIDLRTRQNTSSVAVGWVPAALSAYENYLFVANFMSNSISVIDLTTNKVIGDLATNKPWMLSINNDKLYVVNAYNNTVSVFDLSKFLYFKR